MKFENAKIGMIVKVKQENKYFFSCYEDKYGEIIDINAACDDLHILVDFGGDEDLGNCEDLTYKDENGNLFTHDMLGE